MIVDSSALLAIILDEPERPRMHRAIAFADQRAMFAATWLEVAMVVESRGDASTGEQFDRLILEDRIEVVPFTRAQAVVARDAFRRYGKGRHRAALNFGDCMAYALAKERGERLLFKGDDFPHTDIEPALVA